MGIVHINLQTKFHVSWYTWKKYECHNIEKNTNRFSYRVLGIPTTVLALQFLRIEIAKYNLFILNMHIINFLTNNAQITLSWNNFYKPKSSDL